MKTMKITLIALAVLFGCNNLFAQETISPDRKKAIDSLALEKVRDLSKYIALVGSKETPWSEAQRVIQRAEELFMPGSEMGVSSIYRPEITYFKVREYFERLMRLNYEKVNIDWYNIEYVSDLEDGQPGR